MTDEAIVDDAAEEVGEVEVDENEEERALQEAYAEAVSTVPEVDEVEDDESEEEVDEEPQEEEDTTEAEPEEIEFDFGGTKYAVKRDAPAEEIAESLQGYAKSIEADYTRKTQATAEKTKELESREATVRHLESLNGEALEAYSKGVALDADIKELEAVDTVSLMRSQSPEDRDQARIVMDLLAKKRTEFSQIDMTYSKALSEAEKAKKEAFQSRFEIGKKEVLSKLPQFESRASEVVNYMISNYGVPKEEADNWPVNPIGAQIAYKAMMYDKLAKKAKSKPKIKASKIKPIKAVKGKGKSQSADLSKVQDPNKYAEAWYARQQRANQR